ncbi:MAG: HEAT repeat domain-containing protein [Acidobacteria bacterium]|nr:HEAT repeat domain-containing protein [Acidobacteriota bacterium]
MSVSLIASALASRGASVLASLLASASANALLAATLKATLAFAAALAFVRLATRASAATRHAMLAAAQLAALTMPLLAYVVPPLTVAWSAPRAETFALPAPASQTPASTASAAPAVAPQRRVPVNPLLACWLAGIAIVATARLPSLQRAARIARGAPAWEAEWEPAQTEHRGPRVYLTDAIDQPVTLGSRILLPTAALDWHPAQLRAVLLHERAHVARRDSLLGLVSDFACAVYWFHPLAWLVARRARLEREQACDEAVLAQGVRRTDYAAALLDIARNAARAAHGMAMAERPQLEVRIRAIVAGATPHPRRGARAAVVVAAVAAAPFLAALTPLAIARPSAGEPDLLGDAIASPRSERLGAPAVSVVASGPDAALIATLQQYAAQPPRDETDLVADRARWALGRVRDGELVRPMLDALDDADWRVRAYAAWTLAIAGERRATPALVTQLRDPVWRMRAMAAYALAELADPAAHDAMQRALADPAWQVRTCAVRYLAALHDPADRALLDAMRADRHIAVRTAAEQALNRS